MEYHYFISYIFKNESGGGRCSIKREEPIRDITDIASIESDIASQNNHLELLITSWKRFEENSKPSG